MTGADVATSSSKRWQMPLKLEETTIDVSDKLEVTYPTTTKLYDAITDCDWDAALAAVDANPTEAKTWVIRHYGDDDDDDVDSLDGSRTGDEIMWRFLPIHSACARQPPIAVISALLKAYPEGAKCVDDQGMYALHYACGNQASREVIRVLLSAYPEASRLTDETGMLPIHYLACWGPSTVSIIDMLLVANRDVALAKDANGDTPLQLAAKSKYSNNQAVVEALKRWLGDDGMVVPNSPVRVEVVKETKAEEVEVTLDESKAPQDEEDDDEEAREELEATKSNSTTESELARRETPASPVSTIGDAPEDDDISETPVNQYSRTDVTSKNKKKVAPVMPGDMMPEESTRSRARSRGRSVNKPVENIKTSAADRTSSTTVETATTSGSRSYRSGRTATDRPYAGSRSLRANRTNAIVNMPDLSPRMSSRSRYGDSDGHSVVSRASQYRAFLQEQERRLDMPYYDIDHDDDDEDDDDLSARTERTYGRVLYCAATPKPAKTLTCGTMTVEHMYSPRAMNEVRTELADAREQAAIDAEDYERRLTEKEEDFRMMMELMESKLKAAAEAQAESDRRIAELVTGVEERDAKLAKTEATVEDLTGKLKGMEEQRDDLRQTLTDLSQSHDAYKNRSEVLGDSLKSVNAKLEQMMEVQKGAIDATEVRSNLLAELSGNRSTLLNDLLRLEETTKKVSDLVEAKDCLGKQMEEMKTLSTGIAAVLED